MEYEGFTFDVPKWVDEEYRLVLCRSRDYDASRWTPIQYWKRGADPDSCRWWWPPEVAMKRYKARPAHAEYLPMVPSSWQDCCSLLRARISEHEAASISNELYNIVHARDT